MLDDTRARGDLANAQTRLKGAQERYTNLLAGGNRQQLLSANADLQKATTERDSAQRQLSALERLQQRGAATPDEVAAARDRLARAQADLAQFQSPGPLLAGRAGARTIGGRRLQGQRRPRRGDPPQLQRPRAF